MDAYNYLLSIVLKSFDIDIISLGIEEAVSEFTKIAIDKEKLSKSFSLIFTRIKGYAEKNPKLYEDLILCLVKIFITNCKDANNIVITLLQKWSKEEVIYSFSRIEAFRNRLFYCYIKSLYAKKPVIIANYQNLDLLAQYENISITYLNDIIRNALNKINSYFLTTNKTYEFIEIIYYNGFIKVEDEDLQQAIEIVKKYKYIFLRLIYADVYEYLVTCKVKKVGFDRLKSYIENRLKENDFTLNPDYGMEMASIFRLFYKLNTENREYSHKSVNTEYKEKIRKLYPLYMIEESGIIGKG